MKSGLSAPDKSLAAICGLFCPACTLYIGTTDDKARLQAISKRFGLPPEELECRGCRSEKRGIYCRKFCKMTGCASAKGVDFCGACPESPCQELKDFQAAMPHRLELWESLARIEKAGFEKWYAEMLARYSCSECGTVNSAYDIACRKCGTTPSSGYVRRHLAEIKKNPGKLGV